MLSGTGLHRGIKGALVLRESALTDRLHWGDLSPPHLYCTTLSYLDSPPDPALIWRSCNSFTHILSCHTAHGEHTDTHALKKKTRSNDLLHFNSNVLSYSHLLQARLFLLCCNTTEVYSHLREDSVSLGPCLLHRHLCKLIKIPLSERKVSTQSYLLFQSSWWYRSLVSRELCMCE